MKNMAVLVVLLALQACASVATAPRPGWNTADEKASKRFFDEMHAQFAFADKTRDTYVGRTGKEAREMLNADGYDCAMIVQNGLRASTDTGMPVSADLPGYRCINDKDIPPICTCVVVHLKLNPQVNSKPTTEYQATIDSLILSKESIEAHCGSGPESCWRPN
jgi:hypothetical protein